MTNINDGGIQSQGRRVSAICTVDPGISQGEDILIYADRRMSFYGDAGVFANTGYEIKRLLTIIAPLD